MMTQTEKDETVNKMVAEAAYNGRMNWLTLMASQMGCRTFSPSQAAAFLVNSGVTTWEMVAKTHE